MSKKEKNLAKLGGYRYYVSKEQLEAYAKLTPLQRLQWVDEVRRFNLMLYKNHPEIQRRHERLRRGESILGD